MNDERRRLWVSFFICCSAALLGCGSDGGAAGPPATCDGFAPCGGSLTGTWHLAKTCATPAAMVAAADDFKVCPQGTASIDASNFTGTATFDGQAVKFDILIDASVTTAFPASCLATGQTCASVEQRLRAQNGVTTASCQMTSAGCSCSLALKSPLRQERSLVTSGTTYTETDPTDGSMETSQYCVDGNTLRTKSGKDDEIDVWTR